jgi:HSP20 family protein
MVPTLRFRRGLDPAFEALYDMRREFDRLFNGAWSTGSTTDDSMAWSWPAEVVETAEDIRFVLEAPGFDPEALDVTVQNNVLTVKGERNAESAGGKGEYRVFERRYGRFERSFVLPSNVQADEIHASYENGLLTILLPKKEESKPRRIPIGAAKEVGSGR